VSLVSASDDKFATAMMMETMQHDQVAASASVLDGSSPQRMPERIAPPIFRRLCGPVTVALGLAFTVAWIVFVGYGVLALMGVGI
jgi:hypothetical protein